MLQKKLIISWLQFCFAITARNYPSLRQDLQFHKYIALPLIFHLHITKIMSVLYEKTHQLSAGISHWVLEMFRAKTICYQTTVKLRYHSKCINLKLIMPIQRFFLSDMAKLRKRLKQYCCTNKTYWSLPPTAPCVPLPRIKYIHILCTNKNITRNRNGKRLIIQLLKQFQQTRHDGNIP